MVTVGQWVGKLGQYGTMGGTLGQRGTMWDNGWENWDNVGQWGTMGDNGGQWSAKRTMAAKNTDRSRRRQKPKGCTPKVSNSLPQQGLRSQA